MIAAEHELTPGDPASVARGRAVVAAAFADQPLGAGVVDDAVLAVSELVTNAIAAARDRVCVTVELDRGLARVAVYDDGPGQPVARPTTSDRPHGRGLPIVAVLAQRWGVSPEPPGKWVWAEFPVEFPVAVPSPRP